MKISIIIPTYNRQEDLIRLLDRLKSLANIGVELIVVDDSKSPISRDFLSALDEKLVYLFRGEKLGVSSARNHGARYSSGKYLLFLDDDDDFEKNWLFDFFYELVQEPDLVFCNMVWVDPDGKRKLVKVSDSQFGAMGDRIVIPGAWLIKKELFDSVEGYDEKILFAENTEFFFRVFFKEPKVRYISHYNFIYHPSPNGGSKNLQNMIDSLLIILKKHDQSLSGHVKHLYHQIIGVNFMRFQIYSEARKHLWKAYILEPQKVSTLIRLLIASFPPLAKILYPKEVSYR